MRLLVTKKAIFILCVIFGATNGLAQGTLKAAPRPQKGAVIFPKKAKSAARKKAAAPKQVKAVPVPAHQPTYVTPTVTKTVSPITTTKTVLNTEKPAPKPKTPIVDGSLSLDHNMGFSDQMDSYSIVTGVLKFHPHERHTLTIYQEIEKAYVVDAGQSDVKPADTILYHSINLGTTSIFSFGWRTGASIPISEKSQDDGINSRVSGRLSLGANLLKDRVTLYYRPAVLYNFNQYKQDIAQKPLNLWGHSHTFLLESKFTDRLSLATTWNQTFMFAEPTEFQNEPPPVAGKYTFDIFAGYDIITEKLGVRLGYTQSDSDVKDGLYEVSLYNDETSVYYIGLDYSF